MCLGWMGVKVRVREREYYSLEPVLQLVAESLNNSASNPQPKKDQSRSIPWLITSKATDFTLTPDCATATT